MAASLGLFSEPLRRYFYTRQGGIGETANWGEPLFYLMMLIVIPGPWALMGALAGMGVALFLGRALDSGGGLGKLLHEHPVAFSLAWIVTGLVLAGGSGWFVYAQWKRAGEAVARHGGSTADARMIVDPAFLVELEQDCNAGQPGACTLLGQFHHQGQGVPKNLARGLENYRKGCENGAAASCSRVGWMYEAGEVVRADAPTALGYYQRACDGGYNEACRSMGALWQKGATGLPRDLVKTVAAFGRACEGGDGWSCFTVGLMNERGEGTPQDYAGAAEHYRKACDIRYAIGCQYLGDSYAHGEGVARDDARGRALYLESAGLFEKDCAGGDGYGCFAGGTMHAQGMAVPADPLKARDLFQRGCGRGYTDACAALQALN
jgi:TPR repeat protein